MEKYPAFDQRPLDKCRADVARADVLVLIVAHRYGFRPKQDNPGRKSITEIEYEQACQAGKPRLIFIVDPNHPWLPQWVDTGRDARDLKAFRERLLQNHGVAYFKGPDDLASRVLQGLRAWESTADEPADSQPAVIWNWPRSWNFAGYIAKKRRGFVGREWLFDEVRDWCVDDLAPQALLICADFGVGKTAFMSELVAGQSRVPIVAHHFCHRDTAETLNPATFVRSVASQLGTALPLYKSTIELDFEARAWIDNAQRDPASAFECAIVAPLAALPPPEYPCVLLIDGLDEALDVEATQFSKLPTTIVRLLASHAQRLPPWLKVLVTTRRREEVLQAMRSAFQCRMLNGEDDRNLADIKSHALFRCAQTRLQQTLAIGGMSAETIATFLAGAKQSGGKFLYVVRVLNDLESGALSPQQLRSLPPGMDGFYLDAFERRFPTEEAYKSMRPLLGVLCVMREPSSRAELAEILKTSDGKVRSALSTVDDFLRVVNKRYAFDHLSLMQWLTEETETGFARAGRFSVDLASAETSVVTWALHHVASRRAHVSDYLARHLHAHLSVQQRRELFPLLLRDFNWLQARVRHAGINTLLNDWAGIAAGSVPAALEQALRQAAHVLAHDADEWQGHNMLASQLLGRLLLRQEPEIAELCASARAHIERTLGLKPSFASLLSTPALLRTIETYAYRVTAVAALRDGRLAIGHESGSHTNAIQIWSASGIREGLLEGHTQPVLELMVLDDQKLVSGSFDHTEPVPANLRSKVTEAM